MAELAALIEIYKSVEAAFSIRSELDHVDIQDLIKETIELRKDPKLKDQEEVDKDWEEFKEKNSLDEQILVGGKVTTLNELMKF